MKSEVAKIRSHSFKLTKFDFILTVIPVLIWAGSTFMRQTVITPSCMNAPQKCSKESLLPIDQISFGMEDPRADGYSYFTQNLSGVLAVAVPAAWSLSRLAMGSLSPAVTLSVLGVDLVLILQTASWNGFLTELSHWIVQRPRPFVYYDPVQRGIDPAHYVSFYSGHTSFAAAMTVATFLILVVRGAPLLLLMLSAIAVQSLIISTAYFRILAGRHFLTDVIFGAVAGSAVAWVVVSQHRLQHPRLQTG
ncbi:MAG: phosphatase PAP2 family protein [Bdellovibrionia bacterium]